MFGNRTSLNSILAQYKKLVEFHFNALQNMYFSSMVKKDDCVLLFSDLVEDSYYNFIGFHTEGIKDIINQYRQEFSNRNRVPAFYSSPGTSTFDGTSLIPENFTEWASDVWMILEEKKYLSDYVIPDNVHVEMVQYSDRFKYVEVFHKAYSGDDPDDPYSNLPASYSQSLLSSFDGAPNGYDYSYVWAKLNGAIVGVGCLVQGEAIAGIYGVGTFSQYRAHGIGKSIMKALVQKAITDGASSIILQTESGSKVEKWYDNMGFKKLFDAKYYVMDVSK